MRSAHHKQPNELEPMYASIGREVPHGRDWTFEPKYDGIRVLAHVDASGVRLITRNGNDKAKQFPEIAAALAELAIRLGHGFVLDGEIVALIDGEPGRFQALQSRVHMKGSQDIAYVAEHMPAALMAFDVLRYDRKWLLECPWTERRARLDALLSDLGKTKRARKDDPVARHIRLSPSRASGKTMLERARAQGWEGVIAKRIDSLYVPGERSDNWLKLKIEFEQEFVIGGFTEPRNSRENIGALLLGYFDENGGLIYVGHTGGGFTRAGLAEMFARLSPLIRKTSPFTIVPKTNEPATWVKPEIVVEVKFSEWTAQGKLRQPIYLGTRDDKPAREVTRESISVQR